MNKTDIIKKLNEHQYDLIIINNEHIADWNKDDKFLTFGHDGCIDFNEDIQVPENDVDNIIISDGESVYGISFGKKISV